MRLIESANSLLILLQHMKTAIFKKHSLMRREASAGCRRRYFWVSFRRSILPHRDVNLEANDLYSFSSYTTMFKSILRIGFSLSVICNELSIILLSVSLMRVPGGGFFFSFLLYFYNI